MKAKINENGVFLINRGGAMQAMVCPFGSGNCGEHCPFFAYTPAFDIKPKNIYSRTQLEESKHPHEVALTCMSETRIFKYIKEDFIDERAEPVLDDATRNYVESTIQNIKNFERRVKK